MIKYIFTVFLSITIGSLICQGADFSLVDKNRELRIFTATADVEVISTALDMFGNDLVSVGGARPINVNKLTSGVLFVGTLGDKTTEKFIRDNSISTAGIRGEWEAFTVICFTHKKYKEPVLAVIGSDPRGTAYGILELSRMAGVSPWEWWADVTPYKQDKITVPAGFEKTDKPSVQFRGIFLNDEDWGLVPWSSSTFENKGVKEQIGPETYSKIFELLLRLRANTMWPAMHEETVPFYMVDGTTEASQKYGIVIGSSHCEPLLCNSAGEWDEEVRGRYNFQTNREEVVNFWRERLKQVSGDNNYFLNIGMRGKHDCKMEGVSTNEEYRDALAEVMDVQRGLIREILNKEPEEVPQAFIPYKEVLEFYNMGLDVPDDVTLVWCDDNYGYITRLNNEEERKRSGGSGIYYHISYWGRPHDYLWLSSTQPGQIYSEMRKAWEYGARKLWILNVGDIKPAEYDIEFFMDMAWDIESVNNDNIFQHLAKWASREFGEENAEGIAVAMNEYYRLAMERKPEHMGWSQVEVSGVPRGRTPVIDTDFNPFMFGDEIENRILAYENIEKIVDSIGNFISPHRRDAYYQLVKYPVSASSEMNKKLLYAQKARLFAKNNFAAANDYSEKSMEAYKRIESLTEYYNKEMSGGKWNSIMDMKPRELFVFNEPRLPEKLSPEKASVGIWLEGSGEPLAGSKINIPEFISTVNKGFFITVFHNGGFNWSVQDTPQWLLIEEKPGRSEFETRLDFTADFSRITEDDKTVFFLTVDGVEYVVSSGVKVVETGYSGYEYDKYIALNASGYTRSNGAKIVHGYGYSNSAMQLQLASVFTDSAPYLEYDIYVWSVGDAEIRTYVLPIHPVNDGNIRIAVSVDGKEPEIISFKTAFRSEVWKQNVLRNQAVAKAYHRFETAGEHTIRIYTPDPDIIVDQIMVDFHKDRKFYIVPVKQDQKPVIR